MDRAADLWSDPEYQQASFSSGSYWLAIPEVVSRYNALASGDPRVPWYLHCLSHLARLPVERMLSLGCGRGAFERELHRQGAFVHCDAIDIAPGAIEAARDTATTEGACEIEYRCTDINTIELASAAYDAAWFNMSLHHVVELEYVCAQVARSLKPGGLLFVHEYVGADAFAFPPKQIEAMRNAYALISRRFRHVNGDPAAPLREFAPPNPKDVLALDPTEAIRSSDILGVLAQHFTIVEQRGLGGTLLQYVLQDIAGNFRSDNPESMLVLEMLFGIEDELLASKALPSDFTLIVATPR